MESSQPTPDATPASEPVTPPADAPADDEAAETTPNPPREVAKPSGEDLRNAIGTLHNSQDGSLVRVAEWLETQV